MRDELLALLEERAYNAHALAELLEQPFARVRDALRDLRAEGAVKVQTSTRKWVLASWQPRNGRPPKSRSVPASRQAAPAPTPALIARPIPEAPGRRRRGRLLERQHAAAARVDRLLGMSEPSAGNAYCPGCGRRFMRPAESDQVHCSPECQEKPPAPDVTTRVIDGVTFEAVSVGGRPLTDWPESLRAVSSLVDVTGIRR